MSLSSRPASSLRRPVPLQTLTGLGLILAALSNGAQAGWDCALDAKGEWFCQAGGAPGPADGSSVAGGLGEGEGQGPLLPELEEPPAEERVTRLVDDWVPLQNLSQEQRSRLSEQEDVVARACCGAYVDPLAGDKQGDPADSDINAHADNTSTDLANQTTTLTGNVQISQGYRYLQASRATLKRNPQQVELDGNVTYREPGLLLLGEKANLYMADNTAEMNNVEYLLHEEHVHGAADSLTRSETGVISMINATYTYCPVGTEQWLLKTSSLTLDPNDSQGRARNVSLRVKGVPVFYSPYWQFPLGKQRMSGFLVPSFGVGDDGLDIATPYYFNLAPNYDLTLTPRLITDRGLMLGSLFRHMSKQTEESVVLNMLPGDSRAESGEPDDRWFMKADHDGHGERWASNIDMAAVSDEDYFHDFSKSGLRVGGTSQLRKEAEFDYLPENWKLGVLAKNYKTLDDNLTDPHNVMPTLFADGTYALESGPVVKLHHAMTEFTHHDEGDRQDLDDDGIDDSLDSDFDRDLDLTYYDINERETMPIGGKRYNLDYSVELPLRTAGAFLTPKVGLRHVTQELDDTTVNTPDSNPSATVPVASLDSGLVFERDSQWFGQAYRQTLEPRAFYYYAGRTDQDDIYNFDSDSLTFSYSQLFRDYRLAGEDYIDDANQVSLGVSSRLLSPSTGREVLRMGIGQTYYLENREILLDRNVNNLDYERDRSESSLVGEVAARLGRFWDIRTEMLWDQDKAKRDRQTFGVRYRDDKRRLFNAGYQYLDREPTENDDGDLVDRTVDQTYVSAAYPLNDQWSLVGHWNQDLTNSRNLESVFGFEYGSCCWATRLVARQWVANRRFVDDIDEQDMRTGIFLQFELKSLGNVGDSVDDMLSESIFGYEDRGRPIN